MNNLENIIIIGGGPAGLAAAVYTSRANLNPLVIAGSPPGGQLILTSDVENYPGYEQILGPELITKFRAHAAKFNTRFADENVTSVDFTKKPFIIHTGSSETGKSYQAKAVIIATGAKALWLGLANETRLRGRGVSACATCDGFFFRDKIVSVVGGGDTAMEEALFLTKFAKKVYLIHRKDTFRASKIMADRVRVHPKIEIIWNTIVTDVLGENKVEGIKIAKNTSVILNDSEGSLANASFSDNGSTSLTTGLRDSSATPQNDRETELKVDGFFLAIGHKPDTDVFKSSLLVDDKGYIVTSDRFTVELAKFKVQNSKFKMTMQNVKLAEFENKFDLNFGTATSIPGVFAAGDCVDYIYRQAATAVGMGVGAALDAERWLEVQS